MSLREKYGKVALVAGASEGLGAAFSENLAAAGLDLVLVARRREPLEALASQLAAQFKVQVTCVTCDLSQPDAAEQIVAALDGRQVDVLIYNAAMSYIGRFEECPPGQQEQIAVTNMVTPQKLVRLLGAPMLARGRGAIVLMASLAGFQGSGFLASYAASKAFNRVLAESLWYEWKGRGVDVIACCAGATATPNYLHTKPAKVSPLAPKVQLPAEVVKDCFKQLGKKPSVVTGRGNRIASFFMQKWMSRKRAIQIMGDTTRKMYRL
jgi:short-subunit dehydrogenase